MCSNHTAGKSLVFKQTRVNGHEFPIVCVRTSGISWLKDNNFWKFISNIYLSQNESNFALHHNNVKYFRNFKWNIVLIYVLIYIHSNLLRNSKSFQTFYISHLTSLFSLQILKIRLTIDFILNDRVTPDIKWSFMEEVEIIHDFILLFRYV